MTVTYIGNGISYGLSTDTKPTSAVAGDGHLFFETNTWTWYKFNATDAYWHRITTYPSPRAVGYWQAGIGAVAASGLLASNTIVAGAPAVATAFIAGDGTRGLNYATNATITNNGGIHLAATHHIRQWNPYWRIKFKLSSLTLVRLYLGTSSFTTDPTGDDPLNTAHGFFFGLTSGDTTWQIMHNDGTSGAGIKDNTGITADTNVHTLELFADNANTRYGYSLDGSAIAWTSTRIPTATVALAWAMECQTNEAVAKTLTLYNIYFEMD